MSFSLPKIYPITDTLLSGLSHAEQIELLTAGGASLIQLRDKGASPREFYDAALDAMSSPPEPVIAPAGLTAIEPLEARVAAADPVWSAIADAHAALAHGFEAMALECTGWTRSGVTATTDAAVAILGARSFAEIVEINDALARRGIDAMIESSARLSEISLKAATEASRPMLARFVGT